MKNLALQLIILWTAIATPLHAADENDGLLDRSSTGKINVLLEITDNTVAGFLQTNLDNPDSDFSLFLSSRLIQSLKQSSTTILPFCVISSGGGYYEIASNELPGADERKLRSEFGATLPFQVLLGDSEETVAKYKASPGECNPTNAISVRIKLDDNLTGKEVGRLYGKFKLLVKSE